jgi:hypothetical protein
MSVSVDLLHLFPDLAAIGQADLQVYCKEWVQRPIARDCGVAQIIVDEQRHMQVLLDQSLAIRHGGEVFVPIDELLSYIVDRHFRDASERQRLHASIPTARQRWSELGREYEASVGRVGTLYLICKNPDCAAQMMSDKKAPEGQRINCPAFDIMCLKCGNTDV